MWAAIGVSVVGSLLGSKNAKNQATQQAYADRAYNRRMGERADRAQMESWMNEAEQNGRNDAATEFNHARAKALLPEKAQNIEETAAATIIDAQQQTIAAKSMAMVQANASGSAGASVDQSIAVHDNSMARVADAIDKNKRAAMMGINQEYEDLYWQADAAKKELKLTGQVSLYDTSKIDVGGSTTSALISAGAAGANAWLNNR